MILVEIFKLFIQTSMNRIIVNPATTNKVFKLERWTSVCREGSIWDMCTLFQFSLNCTKFRFLWKLESSSTWLMKIRMWIEVSMGNRHVINLWKSCVLWKSCSHLDNINTAALICVKALVDCTIIYWHYLYSNMVDSRY